MVNINGLVLNACNVKRIKDMSHNDYSNFLRSILLFLLFWVGVKHVYHHTPVYPSVMRFTQNP